MKSLNYVSMCLFPKWTVSAVSPPSFLFAKTQISYYKILTWVCVLLYSSSESPVNLDKPSLVLGLLSRMALRKEYSQPETEGIKIWFSKGLKWQRSWRISQCLIHSQRMSSRYLSKIQNLITYRTFFASSSRWVCQIRCSENSWPVLMRWFSTQLNWSSSWLLLCHTVLLMTKYSSLKCLNL